MQQSIFGARSWAQGTMRVSTAVLDCEFAATYFDQETGRRALS